MAHNLHLDKTTGKTAFVSGRNQKAWHGLGQILPDTFLTAEQCIEHAQLNYQVGLFPVETKVGNQSIVVPDKYATVRTDTNVPLGIVGKRYETVQNSEAFKFFDAIIGEKQAIYETAGALGDGEKVFITAKMPDYIKVGKNDITEVYIVLKMAHDGSGAIQAMITPIRVVCQNTMNMAMREAVNKVSIRHTKNVRTHLEQAHKLLDISHKYLDEFQQIMTELSKKKVTDMQVKQMAELLYPGSKVEASTQTLNTRQGLLAAYETGVGQEKIKGTAYGALNGLTHFLSHDKSYGGGQEGKFVNLTETTALLTLQKGFDFLTKLN